MNPKVICYSLLGLFLFAAMPGEAQDRTEKKTTDVVINLDERIPPQKYKEKMQELQADRDKDVPGYARNVIAFLSNNE